MSCCGTRVESGCSSSNTWRALSSMVRRPTVSLGLVTTELVITSMRSPGSRG